MSLKVFILVCVVAISYVACHGPGGHGGGGGPGGFHGGHGGGGGPGGFHGGHGGGGGGYHGGQRRPWGGHWGRRPGGYGHWGGHGGWGDHGGDRRSPGWRPHEHNHPDPQPKPDPKSPDQPQPKPDPKSPEPIVNFIVHEPQGLEVWIVQEAGITSFGVELIVNKDPKDTSAYCDLCLNTTDVLYGKFLVGDQDVLVKKGDTLSYYVWIEKGQQFTRSELKTLIVTQSIITECDCGTSEIQDIDIRFNDPDKRTEREAIFSRKASIFTTTEATDPETIRKEYREVMINECDIDPEACQTSKADAKAERLIRDPHREVEILEDIVEHMKIGCSPKVTNQLVLLKQAPFAANGDGDLMNFVRSYFGVSAELQSLGDDIVRAIPANPGVGQGVVFEMDSYADKQRILYHVRVNELQHIVDLDLSDNSY